jgi:DnaK suppressor protein
VTRTQLPERAEMATARHALEQERNRLVAEIQAAEAAGRARASVRVDEVSDQKDVSERSGACEVNEAEERRDINELRQVEAALGRIDDGRYGRCVDCDEAIDTLRLQVQPAALRCTACQVRAEHAAGR